LPTVVAGATALAWALQGEIMSAATRQGVTLATYASDWEPDGPAWDETVKGRHVHPKFKVPPIEAGKLGAAYLEVCAKQIAEFSKTQPQNVRQAAQRMAARMHRGARVWCVFEGHVHGRAVRAPPEMPRLKIFGRGYQWRGQRLLPHDVLLWLGYLRYPQKTIDPLLAKGCEAVTVTVDDGPQTEQLSHIRSCWADFDTVIGLPDYPIRVLPSSGVVQTPQWYSLVAETLAISARLPPEEPFDAPPPGAVALAPIPPEAPVIDGQLDDACWAAAPVLNFKHLNGKDEKIRNRTEARIAATADTLYLSLRCFESNVKGLLARRLPRDGNEMWRDDSVEVFLIAGQSPDTPYHQLILNANGCLFDIYDHKGAWNGAGIEVAAGREERAWTLELAIPFADLKLPPEARGMPAAWRLNLYRTRPDRGGQPWESTAWSPTFDGDYHIPEKFGCLYIEAHGARPPDAPPKP